MALAHPYCPKWQYSLLFVVKLLSHVRLFADSWTVARQAPLSMGFPRQEYWSGLPLISPGGLSHPGVKPMSPSWHVDSLPLNHLGSQRLAHSKPQKLGPLYLIEQIKTCI